MVAVQEMKMAGDGDQREEERRRRVSSSAPVSVGLWDSVAVGRTTVMLLQAVAAMDAVVGRSAQREQ